MTVREKLKSMLVNNSMFESQAEEVMKIAIPIIDAITPDYHTTWEYPSDVYPNTLYAVWFITVKEEALKWLVYHLDPYTIDTAIEALQKIRERMLMVGEMQKQRG
jgi:hypothetical protein